MHLVLIISKHCGACPPLQLKVVSKTLNKLPSLVGFNESRYSSPCYDAVSFSVSVFVQQGARPFEVGMNSAKECHLKNLDSIPHLKRQQKINRILSEFQNKHVRSVQQI